MQTGKELLYMGPEEHAFSSTPLNPPLAHENI